MMCRRRGGFVKLATFPSMLHEFLATPLEHGLTSLSKDTYETLFKKYDPKNDGRLAVDEQMHLAIRRKFSRSSCNFTSGYFKAYSLCISICKL